jgi:hypothetical protein
MTDDDKALVHRLKGHGENMERDKGKFVRFIDVATCTEAVDVIEALEAQNARLLEALEGMLYAVCHETGFAAAVRHDSGKAYPWAPLEIAEERARAAIAAFGETE